MRWAAAVALAGAALAGCAHRSAIAGMPAACRHDDESVECLGWAVDLVYIGSTDLAYDDPRLEAYVDGVARRVAAAAGLGREVHVRLVDGQSDGASAMGGDIVYVDRRLLARLDSEAELAGLLAHEITHLVAGHTEDVMRPAVELGVSDAERLRRRQDDEALADERAVEITARTGYAPEGVLAMMRAVEREGDGTPPTPGDGLDRTVPIQDHPPPTIRFARIARVVAGRAGGVVGRRAYLDHIDGMVVGDDPRRGALHDATWVRAASALALDVPRGWKATPSGRVLQLESADGHAAGEVRSIGGRLASVLRGTLTGVTHGRAAGRAVAIGEVPSSGTEVGVARARMTVEPAAPGAGNAVALVDDGDRALLISCSGPRPRASLEAILAGLRPIRPAERSAARPHRLHLVAAPRAGTVGALTKALCPDPAAARALDDPARRVAAGARIKCVVE